jgi:hypothetical protein
MCAADCDYGDFEMRLRYQAEGAIVELARVFELTDDGHMKAVSRPRDVPQLNDYDLYKFLEEGKLTKEQHDALMKFQPEDRYRTAYSTNLSRDYLGIPDALREVLRSLVHQTPYKTLYRQYFGEDF